LYKESIMNKFKIGDLVEVNQVWAYSPGENLRHWFGGYQFVSIDSKKNVIVRATKGIYAGCEIRYPSHQVRKVQ